MKQWLATIAPQFGYDRRRRKRTSVRACATISGALGALSVSIIDVTRHGVRIWSEEPRASGTLLFLRLPQFGLMGFAYVRHCSAQAGGYVLGFEFRDPLTRTAASVGAEYYDYSNQDGSPGTVMAG